MNKTALVITSIASPNKALKILAEGALKHKVDFIIIGDVSSPKEFVLEGCDFYSIDRQKKLDFSLAKIIPEKHYARKNLGYLQAIKQGADIIIETDDDNIPLEVFWKERQLLQKTHISENHNWLNVYRYFADGFIWPRGFALEKLQDASPALASLPEIEVKCGIQQGLADENPDVDAIFRLTYPLPFSFPITNRIALGKGSWCPFNSQNTTWFKEMFMLLYLPSYCSFRMTDIWRSFIALRILQENGQHLLFHEPTVYQDRNDHNLMKDFADEVPGYINNLKIVEKLELLDIKPGIEALPANLLKCYSALIEMGLVKKEEIGLLEAWIKDMQKL
jgi:hypothetical protein